MKLVESDASDFGSGNTLEARISRPSTPIRGTEVVDYAIQVSERSLAEK